MSVGVGAGVTASVLVTNNPLAEFSLTRTLSELGDFASG